MPQAEPDDVSLVNMRAEMDRHRAGGIFLLALVAALDVGLKSLSRCRAGYVE